MLGWGAKIPKQVIQDIHKKLYWKMYQLDLINKFSDTKENLSATQWLQNQFDHLFESHIKIDPLAPSESLGACICDLITAALHALTLAAR